MEIKIDTEFIKLGNFLKLANLVQTGGHGKIVIQEGLVLVNGEVEYQRGRKLYTGDVVEFENEEYIVK